ncbi:Odorant receptor 276 [Nylanderia fulva]|uniref:Odorant receptor n=1 Tax=Nylanderia fulva TaxID=613905 RepID=A0A6G1LQW6_9HYME|nr:odorant receptor 22c-like [Nylanderia fulva]KAF3054463.1 Odorant receptor 276 [Nylanderia fulva]
MKRLNFQNVNTLNNRANMLSGNLLLVAGDGSQFPILWRIHSAVVWLMQLIYTIALLAGIIVTPKEKALKDGTVAVVVIIESCFLFTRIYVQRKELAQLIQKMNDILQTADEIMENIVKATLKPIITPFTIYGAVGVLSIATWTLTPILLILEKTTFLYVDYNLPCAFTAEPFSIGVLIWTTIFMTIASLYSFLKKYSVDIYMMHLVLMLTAQYRYMAVKLSLLFRDSQDNRDKTRKEHHSITEKKLKALCRHQNTVLHISFLLRKLLSVNFSLLYINSVFRFCFIGILMSSVPYMTLMEAISVLSFTMGSITQFFLLCSSVQTLSDASVEVTDKAFDEAWYQFGPSMKRTFILLIMANNLDCKIAAIDKFNLSLPSFMTIMNQSYSVALLFLKAN